VPGQGSGSMFWGIAEVNCRVGQIGVYELHIGLAGGRRGRRVLPNHAQGFTLCQSRVGHTNAV